MNCLSESQQLDFQGFQSAVQGALPQISKEVLVELFFYFDVRQTGLLGLYELIQAFKPVVSKRRQQLAKLLFQALDATGEEVVL